MTNRTKEIVTMARELERRVQRRRKLRAEVRQLDDDIKALKRTLQEAEALEREPGAIVTAHEVMS